MFLSAVDKMDFKRAVSIWYRSKNKLLRGGEANWKTKACFTGTYNLRGDLLFSFGKPLRDRAGLRRVMPLIEIEALGFDTKPVASGNGHDGNSASPKQRAAR